METSKGNMEGKGKEGEGEIPKTTFSGAASAPEKISREVADKPDDKPAWWPKQDRYGRITSEITEKIVYDVGKAILGKSSGGQITKLRMLYHQDLRAVVDLLMQAETKANACEWMAGVLRKGEFGERTTPYHEIYPDAIYKAAS
jgi:hypothetical protein